MKNNRLLVVDDAPENLRVIAHVLKGKDLKISFARNGMEALEKIDSSLPDLVLLDINMPGMDGYEVCTTLKNDPATEHIPVIFVTSKDSPEDIVKGFEAGAVDYLTRPVNSAELYARITTHLELKQSQDIIQQQNQELKELNASKDKFLSILAHDLKNPIAGLITVSELMIKMFDNLREEEKFAYIQDINQSAGRTLQILEDLLQWSRSQSGRLQRKPEKINLRKITLEALFAYENTAEEKGITLENRVPEDLTACADRHMIAAVVRNLVSNAVKFTDSGGTIICSGSDGGTHISYTVEDTGMGIPPENMKRLFRIDGGLSTPGTRKEKGTGLGLILCKEFIRKNHGTISAENRDGGGSVFRFTLPKDE